mmetsp:Transcript_3048/g.9133  ORF Transcript_3048/g.9133 Transcript_3048/m.9133 type:complete len:259 (+) Transcript_3048:568-1344(+)
MPKHSLAWWGDLRPDLVVFKPERLPRVCSRHLLPLVFSQHVLGQPRQASGEHEEDAKPHGPDVAALVGRIVAPQHLRCRVELRSRGRQRPRTRHVVSRIEVHELCMRVAARHQDVLRLDVAVKNSVLVDVVTGLEEIPAKVARNPFGEAPAGESEDGLSQVAPNDQFKHKGLIVRGNNEVLNLHDAPMLQPLQDLILAPSSLSFLGVRDGLQGEVLAVRPPNGMAHGREAAHPEHLENVKLLGYGIRRRLLVLALLPC